MKALFIGGTGTISTSVVALCVKKGWDVTLLNRGNRTEVPEGVHLIKADVHDEKQLAEVLRGKEFDVVSDFIAFTPEHVERDLRIFSGKCGQYFFISSASAYQKPMSMPIVRESTPLYNPYWQYSRDKIACEQVLMRAYRENGFPVTVIRPSHTYCERSIPVAMHGVNGSYQVLRRMMEGKPVIIPGDGLTLWTVTHARDFAVGFEGLMGNCHAIGENYHLTGDEALTWNQIHEVVARALGCELKSVHIASETLAMCCDRYLGGLLGDKSNNVVLDNSKIKSAVPAFGTTIRFEQGVRECVSYISEHPEAQVPDPVFDEWCDRVIDLYREMEAKLPHID